MMRSVAGSIDEEGKREYLSLGDKIKISRELFNAFRRLDILQDLIEDDEITEIMVNGTEHIFYEKGGRLYRSDRRFISEERLGDVIQQIAGEANRYVNEASPIADARLADGSRVNVVLKPVAVNGPILTIRLTAPAARTATVHRTETPDRPGKAPRQAMTAIS